MGGGKIQFSDHSSIQSWHQDWKRNINLRLTAPCWWEGISCYASIHGQNWFVAQSVSGSLNVWGSEGLVKASGQSHSLLVSSPPPQRRLSSFILGYIAHFIFKWIAWRLLMKIAYWVNSYYLCNFSVITLIVVYMIHINNLLWYLETYTHQKIEFRMSGKGSEFSL